MTILLIMRVAFSIIEVILLLWVAWLFYQMQDGSGRQALMLVFAVFAVREAMAAGTWVLQLTCDQSVVMWYGAWAAIPHAVVLIALIGLVRAVIRRRV